MTIRGHTRALLVETAAALFHRQGYAATGLAEILENASSGSGSLYHHFKNKQDLLAAILEHYAHRFESEIAGPCREAEADPIDRLFAILDFYRQMLTQTSCQLGCPIGNLVGELADSHDAVREQLAELFTIWRGEVRTCLEQARARLPAGLDLEAMSMLVLSVMEGGVMQARVGRSLEPFDKSVAMLRDYFDRLMQSTPS